MGVLNLQLQNIALLLCWLWRLYDPNRQLWGTYATTLHTIRPSQNGPIILARSSSFFWRSILQFKQLFRSCAKFQLVSRKNVSFWHDVWVGCPLDDTIIGPISHRCISVYEAKLLYQQLLPAPFTPHHHEAAQCLVQFTPRDGTDKLIWNLSSSGTFSVNSVYKTLSQGGKIRSLTSDILKTAVAPSMRVFFFLLLNDRILTREVLLRRGIQCESECVMCTAIQLETTMHLFFQCPYAGQIWSDVSHAEGYTILKADETASLTYLASTPRLTERRKPWKTLFITVLWMLWRERNEHIFRGKSSPASVLINKIKHEAELCLRYC